MQTIKQGSKQEWESESESWPTSVIRDLDLDWAEEWPTTTEPDDLKDLNQIASYIGSVVEDKRILA